MKRRRCRECKVVETPRDGHRFWYTVYRGTVKPQAICAVCFERQHPRAKRELDAVDDE
jgi:hypothetical protein